MNYSEVYFNRVFHLGETTNDIARNSNIRSFERWLADSPFTVDNLSVERGLYFSGIIQTSKDKEEKKLMYLYVALDIPIQVGDILTWIQDNGTIEKWILLQKIHGVHDAYQTFQMIKCNYELKWIDFNGYLQKSWAYAVSSVDSQVKSNFRMWHSLISPQPNKFAEIIIPKPIFEDESEDMNRLMRGVTFIIENEGWQVVECDWTSVEGIAYMSLTESKVNYEYDDRIVNIAETDRLQLPTLQSVYRVGQEIIPDFTSQTFNEWEVVLTPKDINTILVSKDAHTGHWKAAKAGQVIMVMQLKNYDKDDPRRAVTKEFEITIINSIDEYLFIKGDDTIKLDRYATYTLFNEESNLPVSSAVHFEVVNKTDEQVPLVTLEKAYDVNKQEILYSCVLHANRKNKLGEVTLTAIYGGKEYTKTVKVIPLW